MPDEFLDDDDSAAPEHENAQPADKEVVSSFGALSDDNREAEMAPQKPTPHAASRKTRRKGRTLQQCHVCSKKLRDKCDLRRHQRTHAGEKAQPTRERKQQCQECGKMFRDKYDLRAHQRTHTGKKPLRREECQEGGNMFCAKRDLRRHQQQHTAEKQRPSGANSD
ncbi:zinc finger protein, partial [Aphelenchoides avenae]